MSKARYGASQTEVWVAEGVPFDGVIADSSVQALVGTVSGDVVTPGTPVNTGAVPDGVTPRAYWVQTTSAGAGSIVSYPGGAAGTFSVDSTAAGTVTVGFLYGV